MTSEEPTDKSLDALASLHEAIVADQAKQLAETLGEHHDTDPDEDLIEAEACLRLLERVRQLDSADDTSPRPAEQPDTIGRFRIEKQLGEGSYGSVYLAHDPDLNRHVAVKIPHPEVLLSARLRERFLREAEVAAALRHPAIVPVHQAGREAGAYFISSEYCPGRSLSEWLSDNPTPLMARDAAELAQVLAKAVHHAHSRGVLHRDLKPANVLLSDSAGGGHIAASRLADAARITDFGLARFTDRATTQTRSGAVLGTPAYMAPEQAEGRTADVTSAADIYALGSILYELITGRTPFAEETVLATLQAVSTQEVTPPTKVRPDIPRDLEAVCLKCLEKDPAKRYTSAALLAEDLGRFLADEPVKARHVTKTERAWRWCRRNPALAATSGLAVASLIVGVAAVVWQWRRAEAFGDRADRDRIVTRNALDAMTSEDSLSLVTSQNELTNEQRRFLAGVAETYARLAQEEPDSAESAARVAGACRRLGLIHQRLGEFDQAEQQFSESVRGFEALSQTDNSMKYREMAIAAQSDLVGLAMYRHQWNRTADESRKLLKLAEEVLQKDPQSVVALRGQASGLDRLAAAHRAGDRLQAAFESRQQAIAIREQLVERDPDDAAARQLLAGTYNNHANVLLYMERLHEAESLLVKALAMKRALCSQSPDNRQYRFELAIGLEQLANARYRLRDASSLEELMGEAMSIYRELNANHPLNEQYSEKYAFACGNYAAMLASLRRPEALEIAREAVRLWESRIRGEESARRHASGLAVARLALANLQRDQLKNYADAVATYSAGIDSVTNAGATDDANNRHVLMNSYWGRATTHGYLKDFDAAVADWDKAIEYAPPQLQATLKLARATALVQRGDVGAGLSAVRELASADQSDTNVLYNAACVLSLASVRAENPTEAESLAAEAVGLLRRCLEGGFEHIEHLKQDPELASLREREDYRKLFE